MADLFFDILIGIVRSVMPDVELFRFPPALARFLALAFGIAATVLCVIAVGAMRHIPSTEGSPGGLIILVVEGSVAFVAGLVALRLFWFALVGPSSDD